MTGFSRSLSNPWEYKASNSKPWEFLRIPTDALFIFSLDSALLGKMKLTRRNNDGGKPEHN